MFSSISRLWSLYILDNNSSNICFCSADNVSTNLALMCWISMVCLKYSCEFLKLIFTSSTILFKIHLQVFVFYRKYISFASHFGKYTICSRKLYKTQLSGANRHKNYMFFSRKYSFIALTGENNFSPHFLRKNIFLIKYCKLNTICRFFML